VQPRSHEREPLGSAHIAVARLASGGHRLRD
jgi:hypothetical protein